MDDKRAIRQDLEELVIEFAHRVDRGPTETVADLFTPDGWYGWGPSKRSVGREAIREAYRARAALGPRTARHIFSNLRLTELDATLWSGVSIMLIFAENGAPPHPATPLLVADVEDSYARHDGRWLFQSRQIIDLFVDPQRTPVLPLDPK